MSAAGFFSYARFDDETEEGQLTELRERLQKEVCQRLGEKFELFQDLEGIAWGQNWQKRLDKGLESSTLFIPIITPYYLKRPGCRDELAKFLKMEGKLGRDDLVLPLLYIETPAITDSKRLDQDALAKAIVRHQYFDWRELRREPWNTDKLKRLDALAEGIVKALDRSEGARTSSKRRTATAGERTIGVSTKAAKKLRPTKKDPSLSKTEQTERATTTEEPNRRIGKIPSAFAEPATLTVHPMPGRGDFTSIKVAIMAAKGGERILIYPHHYHEALVIDKPLELIGQGRRDDIVVETSEANVIEFKTTFGRVSNLTLRQVGGGRFSAVDIGQGQLVLEDCDITSQSLASVAVHHGASPILKRNRIHDSKQSGVFIYENAKGIIEDNDIFANGFSGVEIKGGGDPILRRNRIHDQKQSGVFIYENGKGIIEDSDIFANAFSGVRIQEGGDAVLRRNRIHDGNQSGVRVTEGGKGTLEDNEIFANRFSGIQVNTGGNPTLTKNRIMNNLQFGIMITTEGCGRYEHNELRGNQKGAWSIDASSDAKIVRNGNRED